MLTLIRETGPGPSGRAARSASGCLLTHRERDVLRWLAEGKTVDVTGLLLGISPHTVGEHIKNIRRKLNTLNTAHSVAEAIRRGELNVDSPLPVREGDARVLGFPARRANVRPTDETASLVAEQPGR